MILTSADITDLSAPGNLGDAVIFKPFTAEALDEAITAVVESAGR